jgi:5-methylcytosine-specific restriction endonuclease McrA
VSGTVAPLSPGRYEIRFTVNLLLEDLARKKLAEVRAATSTSRPVTQGSRHIPAHVRRSAWARDAGRCAFVATNGRRCTATAFLEFHHVRPYAVGGAATLENIQLRCRAHNAYEADLFYGPMRSAEAAPG